MAGPDRLSPPGRAAARFLRWLRAEATMRTAAIVGAAEFAKARLDAGVTGGPFTTASAST